MATILSVSASPSATSRTARLLRHLDDRLAAQGHDVIPLDVRTLPPEALLHADFRHPAIIEATALVERADGIVIGTPVYKAAYSGLLKSLLDLLPQYALAGKTVLPLATGGTTAHVLAIDYALRPVLNSMGPAHITPGWFTLDKDIAVGDDGTLTVAPGTAEALVQVTDQFSLALGGRPTLLADRRLGRRLHRGGRRQGDGCGGGRGARQCPLRGRPHPPARRPTTTPQRGASRRTF